MYYLSIINDLQFGNNVIQAEEIVDLLFDKKTWIYTSNAPFVKKLSRNDKFILYIAGQGRRYFYASFEIKDKYDEIINENFLGSKNKHIVKYFKYYTPIKNIETFDKKVKIKQIKEKLNFIKDKKNYGLFLRQSVKSIDEEDYKYILDKACVYN